MRWGAINSNSIPATYEWWCEWCGILTPHVKVRVERVWREEVDGSFSMAGRWGCQVCITVPEDEKGEVIGWILKNRVYERERAEELIASIHLAGYAPYRKDSLPAL